MNNKKRMMFVLEEDYYYITMKIISILQYMNCINSKLVDYRKISYIISCTTDDETLKLFCKSIDDYNSLSIIERERLLDMYYKGSLNQPIVKRVLFFLEKKNIICIVKNHNYGCIDVNLVKNKHLKDIFINEYFKEDRQRINTFYKKYNRVRSVKYETFIFKVFGSSEVF